MPAPPVLRRLTQPLVELRTGALDGPFRALKHPNFRRFLFGQGTSLVGTWMQTIAEGWLVLELTHSPLAVGLTTTLNTLPILLFTLYGGVVADRVDRRRFIILLQGIMLLEAATLSVLTLTGVITVHWIWALATIFGFATAFEVPTRQAFLVEMVPPEDLVSGAAINSTVYNLARVAGPMVAGVIVATAGPGAAFAVNALSYVAVIVALMRIRTERYVATVPVRPSIFTGIRFIASRPALAGLTLEMVLLTVFSGSFVPILSVYARDVMHVGATGFGALTSAVGIGASIGAILVGAFTGRFRRARVAVCSAALLGAVNFALALATSPRQGFALLALAGAAMAGQGIMTATALQLSAPIELRGRVMAVYSFVVLGMAPFGAFQAGWVSEHFGVPLSLALSGGVALIGTVLLRRRLWDGEEV
jgi:MFS family permease